jgi:hypothetical protein
LEALKVEDKELAKDLETIGRQLDTRNFSDLNFTGERQGAVNTSALNVEGSIAIWSANENSVATTIADVF